MLNMENKPVQQLQGKHVVVIGGGTGTYTVLMGLKKYPMNLSAIVSMADDGGSNKIIRDEFGLLPTSDIRQCFVALAQESGETEKLMRQLFMYRFHQGAGIDGMTFGNLFMVALADILGSQKDAIEKTSQILKIKGEVIPITLDNVRLGAVYENGHRLIGEHLIDEPQHDGTLKITELFLEPKARINPMALEVIGNADMIVLGPGDLYTSTIANLIVENVPHALQKTKAMIVYVLNLMTVPGQTYGFSGKDHVAELERYMGRNIDIVLVNEHVIPEATQEKYEKMQSVFVKDDFVKELYQVVRADLLGEEEVKSVPGDVLRRSFIRHDPDKLAKVITSLL